MSNRRWVTEPRNPAIAKMRFRTMRRSAGKLLESQATNPVFVALDLRRGNLESLDEYLKKYRGIPHQEVAFELRKLLFGNLKSAKYRLVAIVHPDAPAPSPGPVPRSQPRQPTGAELELIAAFDRAMEMERKKGLAEIAAARTTNTNVTKIQRARKVLRDYQGARWIITPEQKRACMAELRSLKLKS